MKVRTTILIPITLGLMMSACSTTTRQQTESVVESETSNSDVSAHTPTIATNISIVDTNSDALEKEIASKESLIDSLQLQLVNNDKQLSALDRSLDEKDKEIASLQTALSNADNLADLEKQKKSREALESSYAALKLDNDLLTRRINQLENENTSLKQQVSSLESMPTSQDAFKQSYLTLLSENTDLHNKYANLEADNKSSQKQLSALKKENLILGGALSDARAQHQILWDKVHALRNAAEGSDESDLDQTDLANRQIESEELSPEFESIPDPIYLTDNGNITDDSLLRIDLINLEAQVEDQKLIIEEYQNDVLALESALDESADYEARWKSLDDKLALAIENNALLNKQLNDAQERLANSQAEMSALSLRLNSTQQALELNENSSITTAAAIDSLTSQLTTTLQNVQWQVPNEIALHNTFEILVSANIQPSLAGQMYLAELVTDSDIRMISDPVATAVVQNGRLQWRWRVSGLNEKPKAQLNLFVNQQISFEDQTLDRQLYRGNETLSLINNNLFEKYGFWAIAILFGLLGGFLIGRINKQKNTL
jgi:chromosome segregation ATPase